MRCQSCACPLVCWLQGSWLVETKTCYPFCLFMLNVWDLGHSDAKSAPWTHQVPLGLLLHCFVVQCGPASTCAVLLVCRYDPVTGLPVFLLLGVMFSWCWQLQTENIPQELPVWRCSDQDIFLLKFGKGLSPARPFFLFQVSFEEKMSLFTSHILHIFYTLHTDRDHCNNVIYIIYQWL